MGNGKQARKVTRRRRKSTKEKAKEIEKSINWNLEKDATMEECTIQQQAAAHLADHDES